MSYVSSISSIFRTFIMKKCSTLLESFFCIFWINISLLSIFIAITFIYECYIILIPLEYNQPELWPVMFLKCHLLSFQLFTENFCVCIHKGTWSIVFFLLLSLCSYIAGDCCLPRLTLIVFLHSLFCVKQH